MSKEVFLNTKTKYGNVKLSTCYNYHLAKDHHKFGKHAYEKESPNDKRKICNGAGPAGMGFLVPDTIYGLRITQSAHIHDWEYQFAETIEEKLRADRRFINNLLRQIKNKKNQWWWTKKLRISRAKKYYFAVKHLGGSAFFDKLLVDFDWKDLK